LIRIFPTQDAILKGFLDIAIDRLIEDVSTKVFGKRKPEDNDGIAMHGGVKLLCNIFNLFRPGE
jgi:hypothetical protein